MPRTDRKERPLRLKLAYRRVRNELLDQPKSGRALVANPFELDLVEVDYDGWIDDLGQQIAGGTFLPGPIEICPAPKGGGLVRPGVRLSLADRVVYTAAVGSCLKKIHLATNWSQKTIDCAPRINPKDLSGQHWLLSPFVGWEDWRNNSLKKLQRVRTQYVLTADIAGYFENVSLPLLRSDLLRIGCANSAIELLMKCLNQWAVTEHRGLPQGVLASDVLSKLYLESFDRALKSEGYTHLRYSDDVRVFCRSRREAQRALLQITELLRARGLTLQSAKTQIRPADDRLKAEFEGAVPIIKELNRSYIDETRVAGLLAADPSLPASVIDDLVNAEPHAMDSEVIHRAFDRFIVSEPRPNQTMFRYVVRRLGGRDDDLAVEYCANLLLSNPADTGEVLRYFENLTTSKDLEGYLVDALVARDLDMYEYQHYQILDWLWRTKSSIRARTLRVVRKLAFGGEATYVRALARALLGKFGNHADRERLAALFGSSSDPLERAQLLCCLTRLERSRRNALIGRVKTEGPWVGRAATLVRGGLS